ncbi:MAG: FGGY family carbohydrate kinase, partial [Gallionella sp.]
MNYYLGLDFGTSGARACVINDGGAIKWEQHFAYANAENQTPEDWREALHALLSALPANLADELQGLAIDGTSGTVLLCDAALAPISDALLYRDQRAKQQADELKSIAPSGHAVCTATSGLAKFLWLTRQQGAEDAAYFLHQADWLAALLGDKAGVSDYNNALKTGYDVAKLCW